MLGKLGEFLNKDVGALVKDAGKVLNTDVGALAKGAGKVLNADLGDLLRESPAAGSDQPEAASAPPKAAKSLYDNVIAKPDPTLDDAPPAAAPTPAYDPDATQKMSPDDAATVVMAPGGGQSASSLPQLADSLVLRHTRPMPTGTSLLVLLPHSVGEFVRPHSTPVGELTSDPVTAMYSVTGHPVALKLVQCWDEEEARDRLNEVKRQSGENFRMGDDRSWILGETLQGLMYSWTRGNYSFTATAPKGEISMVRFLFAFPY